MNRILLLMFTAIIADNIVLSCGVGCDSAHGASKTVSDALKHGITQTLTLTFTAVFTKFIREFVLESFSLWYLKYVLYVLVFVLCASIVSYTAENIFTVLLGKRGEKAESVITNFATLCTVFLIDSMNVGQMTTLIYSLFSGIGFMLTSLIFVLISEKLELSDVPKCMRGLPIMLVSAGIVALAFSALNAISF